MFFARFVCALLMHLTLIEEVSTGIKAMKYCVNHSYMFSKPSQAFFVSFTYIFVYFFVEVVNIQCILASSNPLDLIYNFINVTILTEFDSYIYTTVKNQALPKILTSEILTINHSTSN